MQFTVLTGDIIDSTALEAAELDALMAVIRTAGEDAADWAGHLSGFGRRGGDGWQIALPGPPYGLRAALFVQAHVRQQGKTLATRIAIARGDGTLPEDRDANAAHGRAFVTSGRLLESMDPALSMDHAAGGAVAAVVRLADHIARGWTPAQARAVAGVLPPRSGPRSEVAKRLGISRQAVDQALHAAGWPAIDAALTKLEPEWQSDRA